jgi:hypothetical protein
MLPVAETYLNIANAYNYLDNIDEAWKFAEKAYLYASNMSN